MFFKKKKPETAFKDVTKELELEKEQEDYYLQLFKDEIEKQNKVVNYLKGLGCFKSKHVAVTTLVEYYLDCCSKKPRLAKCKWETYEKGAWRYYLCNSSSNACKLSDSDVYLLFQLITEEYESEFGDLPISFHFPDDWIKMHDKFIHIPTGIVVSKVFVPEGDVN